MGSYESCCKIGIDTSHAPVATEVLGMHVDEEALETLSSAREAKNPWHHRTQEMHSHRSDPSGDALQKSRWA